MLSQAKFHNVCLDNKRAYPQKEGEIDCKSIYDKGLLISRQGFMTCAVFGQTTNRMLNWVSFITVRGLLGLAPLAGRP